MIFNRECALMAQNPNGTSILRGAKFQMDFFLPIHHTYIQNLFKNYFTMVDVTDITYCIMYEFSIYILYKNTFSVRKVAFNFIHAVRKMYKYKMRIFRPSCVLFKLFIEILNTFSEKKLPLIFSLKTHFDRCKKQRKMLRHSHVVVVLRIMRISARRYFFCKNILNRFFNILTTDGDAWFLLMIRSTTIEKKNTTNIYLTILTNLRSYNYNATLLGIVFQVNSF